MQQRINVEKLKRPISMQIFSVLQRYVRIAVLVMIFLSPCGCISEQCWAESSIFLR